jgi:parvulin-like peptidyl-prolyl isomerase
VVNGDLITLAEYQEELARYKAAVGRDLTPEDQQIVINQLIDLTLLAQAAKAEGFQVADSVLEERIGALDTEDQPLDDWLAANGFTLEGFRAYLKRSLEAAWMRDEIIADVPTEMDQIHAQQMLFYDLPTAELAFQELEKGVDFSQLASTYDPQTKGDLGWFPEGFLTLPELDPILFSLEVGETSDIIETEIGYHIMKVLEKQPGRPLDPAIRQIMQEKALTDWMERRWKLSTIEITLPT